MSLVRKLSANDPNHAHRDFATRRKPASQQLKRELHGIGHCATGIFKSPLRHDKCSASAQVRPGAARTAARAGTPLVRDLSSVFDRLLTDAECRGSSLRSGPRRYRAVGYGVATRLASFIARANLTKSASASEGLSPR